MNETHLAYFGSLEAVSAEKARLVQALPAAQQGGTAILNYDDPWVRAMASRTSARVVTFGLNPNADLVAAGVEASPHGVSFTVYVRDFFPVPGFRGRRKLGVHLPLLGRHQVYAVLAAVAVGLVFDVSLEEALLALADVRPLPGRLNPLTGAGGCLSSTIPSVPALLRPWPRWTHLASMKVDGGLPSWATCWIWAALKPKPIGEWASVPRRCAISWWPRATGLHGSPGRRRQPV